MLLVNIQDIKQDSLPLLGEGSGMRKYLRRPNNYGFALQYYFLKVLIAANKRRLSGINPPIDKLAHMFYNEIAFITPS